VAAWVSCQALVATSIFGLSWATLIYRL